MRYGFWLMLVAIVAGSVGSVPEKLLLRAAWAGVQVRSGFRSGFCCGVCSGGVSCSGFSCSGFLALGFALCFAALNFALGFALGFVALGFGSEFWLWVLRWALCDNCLQLIGFCGVRLWVSLYARLEDCASAVKASNAALYEDRGCCGAWGCAATSGCARDARVLTCQQPISQQLAARRARPPLGAGGTEERACRGRGSSTMAAA